MGSRGCRILRLTWSHRNFPADEHGIVGGHLQRAQRAPVAAASRRGVSSCMIHRSSDSTTEGPGSGEVPSEREGSHGQGKDAPKGEEDRRMWRKWIEERLANSGSAADGTDASFGRSSRARENVENSHFGAGDGRGRERPRSLDSILGVSLRPPLAAPENAENSQPLNLRNPFRRDSGRPRLSLSGEQRRNRSRDPSFRAAPKPSDDASVISDSVRKSEHEDLPIEAEDEFENRVLGSAADGNESINDEFLRDLDEIGRSARGIKNDDDGDEDTEAEEYDDWEEDERSTDLAASNEQEFDLEDEENPYRMRPDRLFFPGQTYELEDLDPSTEPDVEKPTVRTRKRFPAKEVHRIADFRNPRYLSSFIRETSRILPKRHFRLSGKAQRKVAKEIKTARILGLMPFTSMGDPPFRFQRSRTDEDTNARYDRY